MILPPHGPRERARFRAEAEATARLSHPSIVQVYEVGQEDDRPFLSMEYIAGLSLDKQLAASVLDPRAAAELLLTLAQAVAYAHAQGIVHRDLKPANVLIADCGFQIADSRPSQSAIRNPQSAIPKITDFGLARRLLSPEGDAGQLSTATQTGAIVGTPSYMAPEQCRPGGKAGPAADIYSLGAILYEALTGRPPFRGQTALEILEQVRSQEPVSPRRLAPKVPRDLETICLKCLAKQPQQRYASTAALADDLRRFLASEPIVARPVSRAERTIRWCRRNPAVASLLGGIALLLICGSTISTSLAVWALNEKSRADAQASQAQTSARQEQEARALADYRFAQAEKAVEEFLDGIENNERLREADFFDLRRQLLTAAIPFYEEFVSQKPGDAALEAKRGKAYGRLALLHKAIGKHALAAADFEQMKDIFQRLGHAPQHRHELAKARYYVGGVLRDLADHSRAVTEHRLALDLFRELAAEFPGAAEYRKNLASCHNSLANVLKDLGNRAEANAEYRRALAIMKQLVAESPAATEYLDTLAGIHTNLASNMAKGDEQEAEDHHRQALAIRQQLADEFPARPAYREGLTTAHNQFGIFLYEQKRIADAEKEWREALLIRQQLANEYPAVPQYRRLLAMSHGNMGIALNKLGRPDDSRGEYQQAISLAKQLIADFPAIPEYRRMLANYYSNFASFCSAANKHDEAVAGHRQALEIEKRLSEEFPSIPGYRKMVAQRHYNVGVCLARLNQHEPAEAEYRQALALWKNLTGEFPDDFKELSLMATCQRNLALLLVAMKKLPDAESIYRDEVAARLRLMERFPGDLGCLASLASAQSDLAIVLRRQDTMLGEARRLYSAAIAHQEMIHQSDPEHRGHANVLFTYYYGLGEAAFKQMDHVTMADVARRMADVRPDVPDDALWAARFFGRCVEAVDVDRELAEFERLELVQDYGDRAIEKLHEAVRRGFNDAPRLTRINALFTLHGRPEFQQLVREAESQ
jgi:serine/threonine protein kinase/Tfp pilus assembly protein PilF